MAKVLTKENFEKEVLRSDKPVLVDFWAAWCGPCNMLGPVIEELDRESNGRYVVGKINVDEQRELAMAYQVASIPTVLVFSGGKPVAGTVGYQPKEQIAKLLDKVK
jgi:thioredoxin 1